MRATREVTAEALAPLEWHEHMEGYAQYLSDFVDYLLFLSQRQYALYSYQTQESIYFKLHHLSHWEKFSKEDFNFTAFESVASLPSSSEVFIKLNECIKHLDSNIHVVSMCVAELFEQLSVRKLSIFLISDQSELLTDIQWCNVLNYTSQQNSFMATLLENQNLKQQIVDLQEINSGKAKYFSIISHDLRAPFHGILGCADIILNEKETLDAPAERRLLSYLYDTAQSTYGLLENLLNWSMAEGGKFHLKPINFRVNDVVQTVFDLLSAFAYKKQIKLKGDIDINLYAYADVRMVTSILQNLTSNALKFTEANKHKKVIIAATINHSWIEIMIEDEGVGMTYVQMNKLFQEHTIPSTQGTTGEKGTGLGFVLCRQFVEMNKGTISVESKEKVGTKFMIRLPKGQAPW